ncbi:SCO3374 family protein [Streptomyces sp. NPDC052079]|uniref:SCO3374 family protein n=1 Tax=Streptomyces sp. NPDC052079 TaxID=3155526 RepID=UPI003436DEAD
MTSSGGRLSYGGSSCGEVRLWYESVLGWPTVPGEPVRLAVGVRFDVLDVPVEAGVAALARLEGSECEGFPVALCGSRMRLLVAAGSAAELPGLLEWLEWGAPLELDLTAVGAGGVMEAPAPFPPAPAPPSVGFGACACARGSSQGAAVWLRPPGQERGAEASLPTLSAMGTRRALGDCDSPPDLVRLVNTVATEIHRVRLRRDSQALAFS